MGHTGIAMTRIHTPSQLGLLLRSARKACKLTQGELAVRMGVSQSRVSQLELQAQDMTVEQLLSACAAMGLDLNITERAKPVLEPAVRTEPRVRELRGTVKEVPSSRQKSLAGSVLRQPSSAKVASVAGKVLSSSPRKGSW